MISNSEIPANDQSTSTPPPSPTPTDFEYGLSGESDDEEDQYINFGLPIPQSTILTDFEDELPSESESDYEGDDEGGDQMNLDVNSNGYCSFNTQHQDNGGIADRWSFLSSQTPRLSSADSSNYGSQAPQPTIGRSASFWLSPTDSELSSATLSHSSDDDDDFDSKRSSRISQSSCGN